VVVAQPEIQQTDLVADLVEVADMLVLVVPVR
jgi:hypothetical protein